MAILSRKIGDAYADALKGPMGKDLARELRERGSLIGEKSVAGSQKPADVSRRMRQRTDADSAVGGSWVVFVARLRPPPANRPAALI